MLRGRDDRQADPKEKEVIIHQAHVFNVGFIERLGRGINPCSTTMTKEKPMAKIQVAGGTIKDLSVETVGQAKALVGAQGYVATVNGEPASDDQDLGEYDFIALAKPVKAGC